jgi:protein-S-isoprenylcysteine O-methyltransferase Ste14
MLKQRGLGYVLVQALLIGMILFGPRGFLLIPQPMLSWWAYLQVLGVIISALGLLLTLIAAFNLGKNLTPLPCPKDDAQLIQTGLYHFIRHPMYSGVLAVACGWVFIYPYALVLTYVVALFIFFELKTRREERLLKEKFPTYSEYCRQVKKFIPWIY